MKKLTLLLFVFLSVYSQAQIVTTLAGTINTGSGNGTGSAVGFDQPAGVVADGSGNLYVADQNNNEIRKIVISTGVVSLFAGTTTAGSGNGTGSAVSFNQPEGLALDGNGNLFVTELNNNDIRKIVISTGAVSTLAGSLSAGSANGTGTAASFSAPSGIASDGTNLYVADHTNNQIRKIVIASGVVTTLAGSATVGHANGTGTAASFYYPYGIVYDGSGNLYVAEQDNYDIRKIVISTGVVTTLAGCYSCTPGSVNGTGTTATFNTPYGIAMDSKGNLYVGDATNDEIRKIIISSATVSTYAGTTTAGSANGTGTAAGFHAPAGVATDGNGNVYVADQLNNEIREITTAAPILNFTATDSVPCSGTSIQFLDQSANAPTSWSWTFAGATPSSSTVQNPTVVYNASGTYTAKLVATNAYGSDSLTKTNFIYVNPSPTVTVAPPSSSICAGNQANLTASGATNYTWSPSSYLSNPSNASVVASPPNTITYTVNGVSAVGCAGTASIVVTVNPTPTIVLTPASASICNGSSTSITASGATTYAWHPATGLSSTTTPGVTASPTATTTYSVTGTTAAGCSSVDSMIITVMPTPTVTASAGQSTICSGGSTTLTASGANSYTWSPMASLSNITTSSATATPTVATTYTITGTSVNGCTNTTNVSVSIDALAVTANAVNESCNGLTNGNVTANVTGAVPPYNYSWSNGATTNLIYNLAAGTYSVTVTDAIGCAKTATGIVTQPAVLGVTASSTNASCGLTNGTATATPTGGVAPYNYNWSTSPAQAGSSVTGLAAGTYTVTLTDGTGCTATATASVSSSGGPVITPAVTKSTCGLSDGKIKASISGGTFPYRYSWNNGDTLSTDSNLAASTYILTVTDANGCSTFQAINLTDAGAPTITASGGSNVNCNGDTTGSITINVTGGAGGYKYMWSNAATTASITGLSAGPYQVTVTDASGCKVVSTINITEPGPIALNTNITQASCGSTNGGASIAVTGGVTPYMYAWSTGATSTGITNVGAGTYSVTVTDNNGCSETALASVSNTSGPLVTLDSVIDMNCSTKTSGKIIITASGGTPPYTYLWNNSATSQNLNNLTAGNYAVTVTDAAGCKGTNSATITTALPPGISICMVTVDPATDFNTLVWDAKGPNRIAHYIIYRETTTPGIFNKIASVPGDSGVYLDTISNPNQRSWGYEISELDSCGQASPISQSILFKTIHLTATANANKTVSLVWDNFEGATFNYYIIYRDSVAGIAKDSIASVSSNTFGYLDSPANNKNWYYHIGIGGSLSCTLLPKMSHGVESINYNASKSNTGNVTLGNPTSIASLSSVNSLNIYPNPNRGIFNMSLNLDKQQNVVVKICDALGQVIEEHNYLSQNGKLVKEYDFSAFSKGIYTVQVITSGGVTYRKVVIQ